MTSEGSIIFYDTVCAIKIEGRVERRDSDCSKSLETLCEGSMLFGTAISYSFFSKLFQCLPWPATTTVECFFIFMSQIHLKSFLCSRGSELPTPFNPIMIIFLNYYIIKYPLRQKQEVIDIISQKNRQQSAWYGIRKNRT